LHPVASASTAAAGNSGEPHGGRTTSSALTCICRSDIGVYRRGVVTPRSHFHSSPLVDRRPPPHLQLPATVTTQRRPAASALILRGKMKSFNLDPVAISLSLSLSLGFIQR